MEEYLHLVTAIIVSKIAENTKKVALQDINLPINNFLFINSYWKQHSHVRTSQIQEYHHMETICI